ncbi:MAG: hypothetical protein WCP89_04180 [archaeon]
MKQENNVPRFPKKLPGSFWGITSFFNIASYKNKYEHYLKFRESSKKQGLKLLAVEIAFNDKPFELKEGDAEILIQLRGNEKNMLWQRDVTLNIGLKNLPGDCDKFCWVDSDVIFKNDNWIRETSKLLEQYNVVQPFEWTKNLKKESYCLEDSEMGRLYGKAYEMANIDKITPLPREGHTGISWAFRREIFYKNKFYDKMVLSGEGDVLMARAFYSDIRPEQFLSNYPDKAREDQNKWARRIYKQVRGSVFYCPGGVLHMWHGKVGNRFYYGRKDLLKTLDIDKDLRYDPQGILEWSSDKRKLHYAVKKYYFMRNEDGKILREIPILLNKIYYILFVMNHKESFYLNFHRFLGWFGNKLKRISPKAYGKLKNFFP